MAMTYIYAGFLSYAHADEAVAARLHRALETYKIPKGQTGRLSPIFRDTTELTAHHSLSEKIQGAVTGSKVLIVLCSPAAKASHWVNEEIRLFRKIHGEASILCVLAEGTPDTAFPPALLEGGREPLAANLGVSKESFRLGVTQIAAAMLGVGLDTLIQRDTRRKRRRLQAVTVSALIFSTIMGATTFSAVTAQKAAETNRMQAEGLVQFMITDMYEKLEPLARLDILDSIGDRAIEYYDHQDISKLPDDSLARQASARHILGRVALDGRDFERARREIEAAARLTKEIYDRNPDDTDAIFAHAQSEYWLGQTYYKQNENDKALPHWRAYAEYGKQLYGLNPNNHDWIMERGWGANNLALLANRANDFDTAEASYRDAISFFETASKMTQDSFQAQNELADSLGGLAQVMSSTGQIDKTIRYRRRQNEIYSFLLSNRPDDFLLRYDYAGSLSRLLTEGFSQLDQKTIGELIERTTQEYEALLVQEPNNKDWKADYYLYLKAVLGLVESGNLEYSASRALKVRLKELLVELTAN